MSLPVIWNRRARSDLGIILHYIRERSPSGARTIDRLVMQSVEAVSSHPYLHRSGRVSGTREAVVHPNYLYVYSVHENHIEILRVVHARQQYP